MPMSIAKILRTARIIAVVGLSDKPERYSFIVAAYLQRVGYTIYPVNPMISETLGEKSFPDLLSLPEKPDVVDVFRRSEFVPEIVEQAIRIKAPVIWMQEGVIHEEAAKRARKAGITVVMDRCMLKEHKRYFLAHPRKSPKKGAPVNGLSGFHLAHIILPNSFASCDRRTVAVS